MPNLLPEPPLRWPSATWATRICVIGISAGAFVWAATSLPKSEALDDAKLFKAQLLRDELNDPQFLDYRYRGLLASDPSACNTDAQVALAISEARFTQRALSAGNTAEFDKLRDGLNNRLDRTIRCAPYQPIMWLLNFTARVLAGQMNGQTFEMLDLSYRTGPVERWIAIRRNAAAMPLLALLPPDLRTKVIAEFGQMVSGGLYANAAQSYQSGSEDSKRQLREHLNLLDANHRAAFDQAVEDLAL